MWVWMVLSLSKHLREAICLFLSDRRNIPHGVRSGQTSLHLITLQSSEAWCALCVCVCVFVSVCVCVCVCV